MKQIAQGFTLIELLIVISIIGILAAVLIPNLLTARQAAHDAAALAYARHCVTSIESARQTQRSIDITQITNCQDPLLGSAVMARTPSIASDTVSFQDPQTYTITIGSASGKTVTYSNGTFDLR